MRPVLQVVGDYELLEKIAEGGMGTVFKARRRGSAELAAVKILPPLLAKNPVVLKRFEQEYRAASLLQHPNIVRAMDFGYVDDSPYLVMEYVEGESLGARIERDGPMPEAEAIDIVTQVANGLHKAHKAGLIHRDVKPDNILLTRDGVAKLADLGLVKETENDLNLTRTGRGLGTPHFMAPEQFRNAKYVDARSDIYSLGATLYMMLTGELPFKALGPLEAWTQKVENRLQPARELVPSLSERVDLALRRALHGEPGRRPSSCREFIEDLTGYGTRPLEGEVAAAREVWHLRFRDGDGVFHTAQETLLSVRQALKEGLLDSANDVRASRSPDGPYELLRRLPEFRDLILAAERSRQAERLRTPPAPAAETTADAALRRTPTAEQHPRRGSGARAVPPAARQAPPTAPAPPARPSRTTHTALPIKSVTPAAPPQPASASAAAPHVFLGPTSPSFDWGRAMLFLLLALVAGAAGFYLLPLFWH